MTSHATPTTLDSIKKSLVALRMPRTLEMLDTVFRKIEQGEIDAIEALDHLLVEEVTIRENRRVKTALLLARLTTIKTLTGFDFTFQPSLDRNRILDQGRLVATHPVLEGRRQYRIDAGHRLGAAARAVRHGYSDSVTIARTGNHVAQRSLAFYGAIGDQLASGNVTATGDRS